MTKDELLHFLNSDDNQYGLDAIATHGFLTATVVGKPLDNWLSLLFEGHEQNIDPAIKTALHAWQHELRQTLKNEEPIELPIFTDNPIDVSDESDLVAWNIGFVDAMYADETVDWFDNPDTEDEVASLTLPMIVLSGIDDDNPDIIAMRQDDDMMMQFANSLEDNLTELFLLFHTQDEDDE